MNGTRDSLDQIKAIAQGVEGPLSQKVETLICPPATLLYVATALCTDSPLQIGAQDCHQNASGAHTGDIAAEMKQIVDLLAQNACPYTINMYPFISLNSDPSFPQNYAFFDSSVVQVSDPPYGYTNTFDASYDTLVVALAKIGYSDIPIIVGGPPTGSQQPMWRMHSASTRAS